MAWGRTAFSLWCHELSPFLTRLFSSPVCNWPSSFLWLHGTPLCPSWKSRPPQESLSHGLCAMFFLRVALRGLYISLGQSGHLLQTALQTHVPTSISYATIEKHPWEAQSRCQWRLIPWWLPRMLSETGSLYHLRKAFQDVQILIHANKAKQAEDLLKEKILQYALKMAWERTGPGKRATARSGRYFWVSLFI